MAKVKVVLNRSEIRKQILNGDSTMQYLTELAEGIQGRCGDGYEVSSQKGKTRCNARISTENYRAMRDNYKNNTLLKAMK
jgi:hypothetical protein